MCACSLESQSSPRLYKKKSGQQVNGGNSAPLLCSGEAPPGVLNPALRSPVSSTRHAPAEAGPEKGHKNGQRAGAPLL